MGPEQDSASHRSDDEEPQEEDEGTQDTVTGRQPLWVWGKPGVTVLCHCLIPMLCLSPAVTTNGATTFPSQTLCPEGSGQGVSQNQGAGGELELVGCSPHRDAPSASACLQDPEECEDSGAGTALDGSAEPSVLEGDEQEELKAEAEPQPCRDTPQAGQGTPPPHRGLAWGNLCWQCLGVDPPWRSPPSSPRANNRGRVLHQQ